MTHPMVQRPARVPPGTAVQDDPRGWAVVEIRHDGSLGRARLVSAPRSREALRGAAPLGGRHLPARQDPALDDELGLLQAAGGHHAQAARSFARASLGPSPPGDRRDALGHLALVEAYRGDLRQAARDAASAVTDLTTESAVTLTGGAGGNSCDRYARLALALVHLERGEDEKGAAQLDLVGRLPDDRTNPWWDALRVLGQARLHVTTGHPHLSVRLLAGEADGTAGPEGGWAHDVLVAARADALLAMGEPHRALMALTPVPSGAVVEASVVAADACLVLGDVRGAAAVLAAATEAVDGAPLTLQVRAWLLEARTSAHRDRHDRAGRLVARALQAAATEELVSSVHREWHWLRHRVEQNPALVRRHRDLLARVRRLDSARVASLVVLRAPAASDGVLAAPLTERESEVLALLAQMYSTEEIAAALYVSVNTVKTHLKGIFAKLCVNRRAEAVRRGRRLGLC